MFAPADTAHFVLSIPAVRHDFKVLAFGRFYPLNPLLKTLHRALDEVTDLSARSHALATFLRQHQNVLMEADHG
ncbi:hypothetical protein [Pseudomonas idahonensis]|uniref:hypothetical protein n=1 Tax=Pseudomonas idahonensis TaxID=2942628 RepID=UPI0035C26EA7